VVQPGRVDWFLTPRFEQGVPREIPWAGVFRDAVDLFGDLMGRWLTHSPALIRVALGAIAHRPVADKAAGYERLAEYLTSLRIDPNSEDLLYQINRPRESAVVAGLKINRLSRWSVAQFMSLRLAMSGQTVQPNVAGGPFSCRIDLDLSTDGGRTERLEEAALPRLLTELKGMAEELVVRGDIA
jgi:hypothetical protein